MAFRTQVEQPLEKFPRKYSGPGRSGICKCGHSWKEHYLSPYKKEYFDLTGEVGIPGECEHYGTEEDAGWMMVNGERVRHCMNYQDRGPLEVEPF